ncbi:MULTISPECIES: class I SAM-dependent methyltransferase [Streptomonospora]|uniref:Class I SAM-dependent methyltransferase n=2 Tax=Streptomonospora TaxID=104204 RepID=A0ABV9SS54_9ACTN
MDDSPVSTGYDQPSASVYTPKWMRTYDRIVFGGTCRWYGWGPTAARLVEFYREHLGRRHLDVGVGTGLLLDRAGMPADYEKLHLLDRNQVPLEMTARRLQRFSPTTTAADAQEPWPLPDDRFSSVGCSFTIHCLADEQGRGIAAKASFFDEVARVLEPGGTFFGTTLLSRGDWKGWRPVAGPLMAVYRRKGWFDNSHDTAGDLRRELDARFDAVQVHVEGCTAFWTARARA